MPIIYRILEITHCEDIAPLPFLPLAKGSSKRSQSFKVTFQDIIQISVHKFNLFNHICAISFHHPLPSLRHFHDCILLKLGIIEGGELICLVLQTSRELRFFSILNFVEIKISSNQELQCNVSTLNVLGHPSQAAPISEDSSKKFEVCCCPDARRHCSD